MAHRIHASFLGTPTILKDGEEVFFSYSKVNALVYYILVRGSVMRDELSGLLWADKPDTVARKNLRNAIYEAKKVLGADVFISPRKAIIKLNGDIDVYVDVKAFEEDPENNIELYGGDFLQGFYVKDSFEYEEWCISERSRLQTLYSEALLQKVQHSVDQKDYKFVERYVPILLNSNPYDEQLYLNILKAYCGQGKIHSALTLYEDMKQLFQRELGVEVSKEIEEFMRNELRKEEVGTEGAQKSSQCPIGRETEAEAVAAQLRKFYRGQAHESLMIMGDSGSGKSTLRSVVLDSCPNDVQVIHTNCYQVEKNFLLHPWTGVVEGLIEILKEHDVESLGIDLKRVYSLFPQMDMSIERDLGLMEMKDILKFDSIFHTLSTIMDIASQSKRLIICFEDVQWMDALSLSLLNTMLLRKSNDRIMFFLTSRDVRNKEFQHFLTSVMMYKRLHLTVLHPLSKKEIRRLAESMEVGIPVDDELVERLQRESEGNLFLLNESLMALKSTGDLANLTTNMQALFKASCLDLSEEEDKLLTFISFFYDRAPLSMISEYMQMNDLQVLEHLESLEEKRFISVRAREPELSYHITQQRFKEYIHLQVSQDKWNIVHGYLGGMWEKRLTHSKQDVTIYKHLEYHYEEAGNLAKMGFYKLKGLMYYLNFSHEMFPSVGRHGKDTIGGASYFTEVDTLQYLENIESMMKRIREVHGSTREVRELELMYYHLVGRYFIREGKYEKGVRYILDLIDDALELENRDYLLMGYKQMIYYNIQIHNAVDMKYYLETALDLAVECNYHKEVGILLRLKGLNMIMLGDFVEAERLLQESLSIFMVTQTVARRYALNIGAAYSYLGDIHRGRGDFTSALEYYDKAMIRCPMEQGYSSWVVFACNAGIVTYNLGDYDRAKEYFTQAYDVFQGHDIHWRRPIVEAYLSLLAMRDGEVEQGIKFLEDATVNVSIMNNPQESGYVNMAIAFIKANYEGVLDDTQYSGSVAMYAGLAMQYLDVYRDTHERQMIQELLDS